MEVLASKMYGGKELLVITGVQISRIHSRSEINCPWCRSALVPRVMEDDGGYRVKAFECSCCHKKFKLEPCGEVYAIDEMK